MGDSAATRKRRRMNEPPRVLTFQDEDRYFLRPMVRRGDGVVHQGLGVVVEVVLGEAEILAVDEAHEAGEELLDSFGAEVVVGDRTIDVHIRKLREKLGDKHIKTVKGVGYKFKS